MTYRFLFNTKGLDILSLSSFKIDFVFPGLNYRLSEINSVLGLDQFSLLNKTEVGIPLSMYLS